MSSRVEWVDAGAESFRLVTSDDLDDGAIGADAFGNTLTKPYGLSIGGVVIEGTLNELLWLIREAREELDKAMGEQS